MTSWSWDPWLVIPVAIAVILYWRGVSRGRGMRMALPRWRVGCFSAGVAILLIASISPIDALGHLLLWVHMVQHWMIAMCAAPLIVMGAPQLSILRGLPASIRRDALGPFLASSQLRWVAHFLTRPAVGWIAFAASTWAWHYPALYEAALESQWIHRIEHMCFLIAAMLFWWQICAPWPWRRPLGDVALVLFTLSADVQNTVFSAIVAFSDRVIYASYGSTAPALGWDALRDQQVAGAFMWTAGQLVMLPVAVFLTLRALRMVAPVEPHGTSAAAGTTGARKRHRWAPFDLLRSPFIGVALRSRRFRGALRWGMVAAAAAVVVDGLLGPSDAPSNLAGAVAWNHWRAVVVVGLLLGANFACMACPLVAARNFLRRFVKPTVTWPTRLRSKWIAVGLVSIWLVLYEALDLWSSPVVTAWLVIGYFAAVLAIDGLFRGASFCKWVCPIGQLQMFQSLVSPLALSVRVASTCDACVGKECIRGAAPRVGGSGLVPLRVAVPGCELELFQPAKKSSFDCTLCMDCVDACPHDNVGVIARSPVRELARRGWSSSIGSIGSRLDITALLALLTFGAFANALGMTGEWLAGIDWVAAALPAIPPVAIEALATIATTLVLPVAALLPCALLTRPMVGGSWRQALGVGVHALVPMGAAMWLAHWFFHGATGLAGALPVMQRFASDWGISGLGEPDWSCSCCGPTPHWIVPIELLALQCGLLLSGYSIWRAGCSRAGRRAIAMSLPWWALALLLWALGSWIVLQPMQMRGMAMP